MNERQRTRERVQIAISKSGHKLIQFYVPAKTQLDVPLIRIHWINVS